eukprot:9577319-Alexandrium_andersonii.AAC.1
MSASHVGSEMCIRDRRSSSVNAPAVLLGVTSIRVPACRLASSTIRATVSYTHLTLPTICSV